MQATTAGGPVLKSISVVITLTLGLSACVNIRSGTEQAEFKFGSQLQPGAEDAIVSFYHPLGLEDVPTPLSLGSPVANVPILLKANNLYQIWDSSGLVGFLPVSSNCIQVRVKPGRQVFVGRFVRSNAGNWTVLEGNVAAGKTYVVKVSQRWNTWKPSVSFEAQIPDDAAVEKRDPCMTPLVYDRTSTESSEFWDHHVAENQGVVRKVFEDLENGGRDYYFDPVLKPENGR